MLEITGKGGRATELFAALSLENLAGQVEARKVILMLTRLGAGCHL